MNEQTFVIIKPDAIDHYIVGRIISRLEDIGLSIERIETRHKNADWCQKHYTHVYAAQCRGEYDDPIYSYLEIFMTGQLTIGIVLSGPNAIKRVRLLIGVTNPLEAEPGTIRGDWGKDPSPYNLVHASDSVEAAKQEIKLYFDKETDQ